MRNKMYLSVATVAAIILGLGAAAPAFAQTTTPTPTQGRWGHGMMRRASSVFGVVSAINGSTHTVTSPARAGGTATTYAIDDAANATVTKNGASSTLAGIAVGDTVMVQGTVSGTSVTATAIRDGVPQGMHGMTNRAKPKIGSVIQGNGQPVIGGNVSAISGNMFTVANKSNVTYAVDAISAKIVKAGATSTIANIALGDSVIVQGSVNGTSVVASSVIDSGAPKTAASSSSSMMHRGFFGGIAGFLQRLFGFF